MSLKSATLHCRLILLTTLILCSVSSYGQKLGDLMISPTRISLDDRNHGSTIVVVNSSQNTVRYRLNLIDMIMNSEGVLQKSANAVSNSAIPYIRLSPKEITLTPGSSQKIRILFALPPGTPAGEFRSHLEFEPIAKRPNTKPSLSQQPEFSATVSVRLVVTIPLIVRTGTVYSAASITDASLDTKSQLLRLKLNREGNQSIRGDFLVFFKPTNGGKKIQIGQANGLAVYYPNASRFVQIPLSKNQSTLSSGEIEIQYSEVEKRKGGVTKAVIVYRH